ncbi:MAG: sugar phosphate isomerase/epimerase, partial [Tannerella sp.]|nr:sugar phosphate isomerase/epimerase [Tannerella sp.]
MMNEKARLSRRGFLGASAALAGATLLGSTAKAGAATTQPAAGVPTTPSSEFRGVHVGAITYSWRSMPNGLENVIKYCKECGITSIELMSDPLEIYFGAPESPMSDIYQAMQARMPKQAAGQPRRRPEFTADEKARIAKYQEDVLNFRLHFDYAKADAAKKLL